MIDISRLERLSKEELIQLILALQNRVAVLEQGVGMAPLDIFNKMLNSARETVRKGNSAEAKQLFNDAMNFANKNNLDIRGKPLEEINRIFTIVYMNRMKDIFSNIEETLKIKPNSIEEFNKLVNFTTKGVSEARYALEMMAGIKTARYRTGNYEILKRFFSQKVSIISQILEKFASELNINIDERILRSIRL